MFKRYISPSTPHPIRWPVVWGQGPHQGLACKNSVNICWMSWRRQDWEGSNSLVSLLVNICTSCLLLHKILPQNSVAENSRHLSPNCCCSEIQEQNTWVSWKVVVKILVKAAVISRPSWGKVCCYSVRWFASAPSRDVSTLIHLAIGRPHLPTRSALLPGYLMTWQLAFPRVKWSRREWHRIPEMESSLFYNLILGVMCFFFILFYLFIF